MDNLMCVFITIYIFHIFSIISITKLFNVYINNFQKY